MSDTQHSITLDELAATLGSAAHPIVIDARREAAFRESERMICGARRVPPEKIEAYGRGLKPGSNIVTACVHGHEVGQNAAAQLRALGHHARYLAGGQEAWFGANQPSWRKSSSVDFTCPTRWVTRARPKIDRIACPWLIRRFIDPDAEVFYVPASEVLEFAEARDATPFDIPGVAFSHRGEGCSFDAFLQAFDLAYPPIQRLATIVRGADTSRPDLTPQSAGLLAISLGLGDLIADDLLLLDSGMILYDSLYRWLRDRQDEEHSWPPREFAA